MITPPVLAQTAIPPQLTGFLCQNYSAIERITPEVLLVVSAVQLLGLLVIRGTYAGRDQAGRRTIWVFSPAGAATTAVIAIALMQLSRILGTFGLTPGCP